MIAGKFRMPDGPATLVYMDTDEQVAPGRIGDLGLTGHGVENIGPAGHDDLYIRHFLVQHGFLQRTARGRVATPQAYRHFGFTPRSPEGQESLF